MRKSVLLVLCALSLTLAFKGWAEEEENEGNEHNGERSESRKLINTPLVMNSKFKTDCTSCHMAYPPGLLPERSWTKMMGSLDKHFGEDASLDEKTRKEILDFLVKNSSDHSNSRRSEKILSTINKSDAPLRISETSYFIRKHDEISANVYKRKAIGSKANCLACHSGAESGNFNEHEVRIPKASDSPVKSKKK
jgi:hypothetical protein